MWGFGAWRRRRLVIDGPLTPALKRKLEKRPTAVHLNAEGTFGSSLEPLTPYARSITELTVTDVGVSDLSALAEMTSLETLDLWPSSSSTGDLHLAELVDLRTLAIDGHLHFDLVGLQKLEDLTVERLSPHNAQQLAGLPRLVRLRLLQPSQLPDALPPNLKELIVSSYRWAASPQPISIGSRLSQLTLDGVRGLARLDVFSPEPTLTYLYAEDCPDLISVAGVNLSTDAEVRYVGRTPLRTSRNG